MLKIFMKAFWWLVVKGWLPDFILRWKIRNGLKTMLVDLDQESCSYEKRVQAESDFVKEIRFKKLKSRWS